MMTGMPGGEERVAGQHGGFELEFGGAGQLDLTGRGKGAGLLGQVGQR
jgi:hypothetical protein